MPHRVVGIVAGLILLLIPAGFAFAQTGGMGLNPSRLELEILPGQEKTTSFQIESPPSDVAVRGQLLLSLTDWDVNEDGTLRYVEAATLPRSASSWIVFSPSSVTIASGQSHMVRVTVRAPENAAPGVYRTALFVQERPPAAAAKKGERLVYLRFRYVFTLYVIVPPVQRHAEVADIQVVENSQAAEVRFEMKNAGTGHLRPIVSLSVLDKLKTRTFNVKDYESMILLPGNTLKQSLSIPALSAGEYEVELQVDFQDGSAIQSLSRTVRVNRVAEDAKVQIDP